MIRIDPGPAFRNISCGIGVGSGINRNSDGMDSNGREPRGVGW
jgi:hypothetical protein